jgi:hypothetical protein
MKKNLLLSLAFVFCLFSSVFAQTTISTSTGTTGYTGSNGLNGNSFVTFDVENTNSFPMILDNVQDYVGSYGPVNSATISLWYSATSLAGTGTVSTANWTMIKSSDVKNMVAGYNTVLAGINFLIPANTKYRFAIVSSNGITFSGNGAGSATPSIFSGAGVNLLVGDSKIGTSFIGYSGTFPTMSNAPRWFTGGITVYPAIPCTGTPVAGLAISTLTNNCSGSPFTLDLSGSTVGTGITYQWDSSSNGTVWASLAGDTTRTFTKTQSATSYYRCNVTCSGSTATSTPIQVINPLLASGTYTIDASSPTAGTNFQTFADAINYISCGINGPVVFNVNPNWGSYNEQVTIPQIFGASATNTITINGNGATLLFASTNTNARSGITLKGADYVVIDSLTIEATGTYGWGILLTGKADYNVVKNCTIKTNDAYWNTNYLGVVCSGSESDPVVSGDNANYNLFSHNTVNGGYYSFSLYGGPTLTNANKGNVIKDNVLTNMYYAGVNTVYQTSGLVISGNDISRPTRASLYYGYGIYISGGCYGILVEKNKIHNLYDATPNSSSDSYGIYIEVSGKTGRINHIENNIIYNFNGNGTAYGLYTTNADSLRIYHNTILLDDAATTSGMAYGFFMLGVVKDVEFKNNIISITRAGTGKKRGYYFSALGSNVQCNNNVLFFNPQGGTNNYLGQYSSTNYATFADWQTANNNAYDQQGFYADPMFTNPSSGDLRPMNPLINDVCSNLGVLTDITGATRGATTDPGAFEFTPTSPCTTPPTAGTATTTSIKVCANSLFALDLTGNTIGNGQTYTWEKSANGTSGWTAVTTPSTNALLNLFQVASTYYRCGVKCGATAIVYSTTIFVSTPTLVAGNFTINANTPTGGTNFQTFTEALSYISCGISGPVVFNVAAGTTYNEMLMATPVLGSSAINTIRFNGNGATISLNSTDAANRTAITLNGADHFIFDSLMIDVSTGTYGWGIVLTNGADSNTISNCVINCNVTSTSQNYGGIFINGLNNQVDVSGNNGNYNNIIGNTINGGYYGIYLYGSTTNNTLNNGNKIVQNTINDISAYSIYAAYESNGLVISQNNISRPTFSTNTNTYAAYGVYLATNCYGALVERNRIHNMFDGMLTNTGILYGFYINTTGKSGLETKVFNNLIFNNKSNGTIYGIYNLSGDSMLAYHNTVVFDDVSTTTGECYGFVQFGFVNRVEFKNNIVVITRAGTGTKRCIYLATSNSKVISNNNVLYMDNLTNSSNFIGQYYTTNYSTLADWQTANSGVYDLASISVDPSFINPTVDVYLPTEPTIDNIGANVGVTIDIDGNARTIATPDPGAFEFIGTVPIKLSSFTGNKKDEINELKWTTLNEINNAGFELQRSSNATDFTTIKFIVSKAASGNSSTELNYVYDDEKPNTTNYYRLKQIDKDGKSSFSSIVLINNKQINKLELVCLYPNPVINSFNLVIDAIKDENVQVSVTDIEGKIVLLENKFVKKGENILNLNVSAITNGTYFVKLTSANNSQTSILKFVKH